MHQRHYNGFTPDELMDLSYEQDSLVWRSYSSGVSVLPAALCFRNQLIDRYFKSDPKGLRLFKDMHIVTWVNQATYYEALKKGG